MNLFRHLGGSNSFLQPLTIRGAQVWEGEGRTAERDLYITNGRIDAEPHPNALIVALSGYTLFPAFINAHDHLELNHYPRTKFRERYDNAHQWGEDMNAHLNEEPFKSLRAYPLKDRCFIGGLKNLMCGALTVAHHNPPHKCLFAPDFPVRVLKRYGWTHSLHFNSDEEVVRSYRNTPPNVPWFIHLAEGTDDVAAGEYQRLKALGCVGKNTVIVHGVGMTDEDIADAASKIRGLVWCPSTNLYLLGQTTNIKRWLEAGGNYALGSDSRLTADRDLLVEQLSAKHVFFEQGTPFPPTPNMQLNSHLHAFSDLSLNAYANVVALTGTHIHLIMRGGIPQIGDPDIMAKFPHIQTVEAILDGVPKLINLNLARQIARCSLQEAGLELLQNPFKRKTLL